MTCREFYESNAIEGKESVVVLEGKHPSSDSHIFLSIFYSESDGWGIGTEEDTVLDNTLENRNVITEATEWLESNFGEYEKANSIELSALYDDILSRLLTTSMSVDITHSELSTAIAYLEEDKISEAMNFDTNAWDTPILAVNSPSHLPVDTLQEQSVVIISEQDDWHTFLVPICHRENFNPISAKTLDEGFEKYQNLSHCALILDAKNLSDIELGKLRTKKIQNPSMFLVAIVAQPCPYEEEILYLATEVYPVPVSPKKLVITLRRYFFDIHLG